MSVIKNIKLNNFLQYLIKIAVFIFAIYFVVDKLNSSNFFAFKALPHSTNFYLIIFIVVVLSFINWFLESLKFNKTLPSNITIYKSVLSVYAGNATSIVTPNRLGTFIGRKWVLKSNYPEIITATAIGNLAQLATTALFGIIGGVLALFYSFKINHGWLTVELFVSFGVLAIALLVFYYPKVFLVYLGKFKFLKKYTDLVNDNINLNSKHLTGVLILAILRYIIFIVQFYLLFKAFLVNFSVVQIVTFVGILYLFVTFVPSAFMGNLGTKEALALLLLQNLVSVEVVVIVSLAIWVVNVALSSLIGGVILLLNK